MCGTLGEWNVSQSVIINFLVEVDTNQTFISPLGISKVFFALCLLRAHEANGWKVFARSSLRDYGHKFCMHFASARLSAREPFNGLLSIKIVRVINKPIHVETELIKQHKRHTLRLVV